MPYTSARPPVTLTPEELRASIPGWGADLDPADRPSHPKEQDIPTGARWDFPDRQSEKVSRERSIEHAMLTPVFGTVQPLRGVSGLIRRFAYARFGEGRLAHWLLLVAGDRVDVVEHRLGAIARGRPDNPITETGILAERLHGGIGARLGQGRADWKHQWLDPFVVLGPGVLAGTGAVLAVRRLLRRA